MKATKKTANTPTIFGADAQTLAALKVITAHLGRGNQSEAIRRAIIEAAERIAYTESLARMDAGKTVTQ
jgi:hypothetical protein